MPKAISAEEIAKVKAEWEEKEKKKEKEKEKAKEKDKEKDKDDKAGDKGKEESKSPKIPATPSTPPPPAHERYTLHRNFFSSEYKSTSRRAQNGVDISYQCVKMNTDGEDKLHKLKSLRLAFLQRLEGRLRSIR